MPKISRKPPTASDPARFSKSFSFQHVPSGTHRPAPPRRPPQCPPCPAIVPGSDFPFSRKPETRPGQAAHRLIIFPVLSEGWGEGAAPGRSAATADWPAEQSLNRPGSQKKERNSGFFSGFPEEMRSSRNHSTRAPLPHLPVQDQCRPPTPHP